MEKVNIPEGYQQVIPYLIVPGGLKFIEFAKAVFGAIEQPNTTMRDQHTVQHAEIKIGDCTIMLADSTAAYPPQTAGMFVYVDDCDTIHEKALNAGATQIMPPNDMPYGRASGVKDPFGNVWWITSV